MNIYIKGLGKELVTSHTIFGGRGEFRENANLAESRLGGGTSLKMSRLLSLGKYVELTAGVIKGINVSTEGDKYVYWWSTGMGVLPFWKSNIRVKYLNLTLTMSFHVPSLPFSLCFTVSDTSAL